MRPVECGCCKTMLRRKLDEREQTAALPPVWTRTLVRGEFLPSCGPECAKALREGRA